MNAKLVILSQRERHVDPQFNMHVTSHCLYIVRGGERFTMNMASRSGKGKTCAAGGPGVTADLVPLGPYPLADLVPLNEILADLVPPQKHLIT